MKALLKRTIEHDVEIALSGADIATLFWELDELAQADFFNHLGKQTALVFQLQAVLDSNKLNASGSLAMSSIGEYSPFSTDRTD